MTRVILVATDDGIRGPHGEVELAGRRVMALALGQHSAWAVVEARGIWRRTPAGPWAEVAVAGDGVVLTCLAPRGGGLLVGTAGAGVLALEDPDACPPALVGLRGFEEVPGRDQWYTPWGGPPDTRSLAVAGDGALYANVHVGGILRSIDGGRSWAPTIDLHADVHQVLCPLPERPGVVMAACADGLAQSRDGGKSWRLREDGLPRTYCRAVAAVADTVLVSASDGPDGAHAGVYRAPLEGWGGFERCRPGLPEALGGNVDTGWLAASGELAAVVTADGDLFSSKDQGSSWDQLVAGLLGPRWLALG